MKRYVLIALAMVSVLAVAAPVAQGLEPGPPLHSPGDTGRLGPVDQPGSEIHAVEVPDRFPHLLQGAWIRQHRADSSWVHGNTRYWDKLICWALSQNRQVWTNFVSDAKKGRIATYSYETQRA